MRRSVCRRSGGVAAACAAILLPGPVLAAAWTAVAGDLGRDDTRFAVHAGVSYGTMEGSEVEDTEPARGIDVGFSVRVLGSISVLASYAVDRSDVSGQLPQIIDQNVRADGRSGHVIGQVESRRLRAGLRVDAYREQGWRFQPYIMGAVTRSIVEVTLDSVDGQSPPSPVPSLNPAEPATDISSFDTGSLLGALGRIGMEVRVSSRIGVDVNGTVEVVEFEPGTNTIFSGGSGLVVHF
jgi:hypothetical protein